MADEKNLKKRRISIAVAVTFAVILAVGIIVMFSGYLMNMRGSVLSNASAYIKASVSSSSKSSAFYFSNRLEELSYCAKEAAETPADGMQELLSRCCEERHFFRAAYVSVQGDVYTSDGEGLESAYRLFAQQAFSGKGEILPASETSSGRDLYSSPVTGEDGTLLGAVVAGTLPVNLSDIMFKSDFSVSGTYYIISEEGRVLFRSEESSLFTEGEDIVSALEREGNDVNKLKTAFRQSNADEVAQMMLRGEEYLVAYSSIDGQDWTILMTVPVEPIIQMSQPLFVPSIAIFIGTVSVFIVLLIYAVILAKRFQRHAEEVLAESRRKFYVDSVTGFDSWHKFLENYEKKVKNTGSNHAFLSLDIDKFKAVNDMLGFDGGNAVLKQMAEIISRNIGETDIFSRNSADRFCILVEYRERGDLIDLVKRIISDVGYQITAVNIFICIGIYLITDRSIDVHTAADRADIARTSIKNNKESAYRFFDNAMLENIRREHFIENIMESALERGEFLVYLQPKFGLTGANEVTGAEALVRWKHNGEIISPGQFIPLFERNGFVTKLDFYMFREVCRLQKSWLNQGYEPKIISVNMSRAHLRNPDFVKDLSEYCKEFQIDPKYFEIEITESAAYENIDILMTVFTQIKDAGFHVSIDDFGTGYSSLNMLKDLPVDVLKIDRSFLTEDASESENASKIIGCVVSLAASLNISTICEGIETKEQAKLLMKLGCNMAQGFFFARPMPVSEYEKLVYKSVTV